MHSCDRRLCHEFGSGSKHLYLDQSLNIFRDINGWLWKPSMVKICHQMTTIPTHPASTSLFQEIKGLRSEYKDSQQSKSDKSNVATSVKYGVYIHLHHKTSWRIMPPLTGEHLEQAQTVPISPKDPHMAGCFLSQVNTLTNHKEAGLHTSSPRARFPTWLVVNTRFTHYDWVDHNGRMHKNTKVTHRSNIPALSNLSFEVPLELNH